MFGNLKVVHRILNRISLSLRGCRMSLCLRASVGNLPASQDKESGSDSEAERKQNGSISEAFRKREANYFSKKTHNRASDQEKKI
jgi:hypothetical protein